MSFDRLVVLCRQEEMVVEVFRGEVVDVHDCGKSKSVAYRGVYQSWRTRRDEGWAVCERIGEVRSCLTLVVPLTRTLCTVPHTM